MPVRLPARSSALLGAAIYAAFILVYREANRTPGPRSGPLLDSTLGMIAGALVSALFDPHFTFVPGLMPTVWLVLLAIGSQVIGWLLIGTALPQLPVVETSVLLLGQPVFTVIWGVLLFGERLSALQWAGSRDRPRRRRGALVSARDRKKPQRSQSR